MALEAITTTGPTIVVSTKEDLIAAYDQLSNLEGGGTVLLEPGSYGNFVLSQYSTPGGDQPVIIKSADASDPAHFTQIYLRELSDIRFEDLLIDGTELGLDDGKTPEFGLHTCTNIQLVNSTLTFDVNHELKGETILGDRGIGIRDSEQILIEGNYIDGHVHGLGLSDVVDVDIIGNEFTNIQGDGIRGGGLVNVNIVDNYFHDFHGVVQDHIHSDLIQIWGADNDLLTQNVVIDGNILMATDAASQSIFIRNEEFGDAGDPTAGYFQNITITNNLIYNGMRHGIHVADAEGLIVDGNTLIWNPDAKAGYSWETPKTSEPIIVVRNTPDATVTNNIVPQINARDDTTVDGNELISFSNPEDSNYVGHHFVGATGGSATDLAGLYVLSTSPFYGMVGSTIGNLPNDVSNGVTATMSSEASLDDRYVITFEADAIPHDGAALSGGYTYHWTFGDGSSAEGQTVVTSYDSGGHKPVSLEIRYEGDVLAAITRNIDVVTKDILALDFESGVVDLSDAAPDLVNDGELVSDSDDTGFLIGDGNKLAVSRSTAEIYNLESFGLALDLEPTGDEHSGVFLDLDDVMEARVTSDGHVSFSLTTDQGTYSLVSRDAIFDDGAMHRIGVAFDGDEGRLELFADGESVSTTEAWGVTPRPMYQNVVFGNTFHDSMDAILDNIQMSVDPAVAAGEFLASTEAPPPIVTTPVPEEPEEETPPQPEEETPPQVETPPEPDPTPEEETDPDASSGDDDGGRGAPPKAVKSEGMNPIKKFIEALLKVFGLSDDDDEPVQVKLGTRSDEESAGAVLSDIVPVVEGDDSLALDEDEPEAMDIAA